MNKITKEELLVKSGHVYDLFPEERIYFSLYGSRGDLYYFSGMYFKRLKNDTEGYGIFCKLTYTFRPDGNSFFAYYDKSEYRMKIYEVEKETLEHFYLAKNVQKYSAGVICIHPVSGQILGATRRNKPNDWGFVGGSVEPGETTELAANREFKEETGVSLTQPLIFVGRFPDNEWEVDIYITSSEDALKMTKHFTSIPKEVENGILVGYIDYATILKGTFVKFNSKLLNTYLANSMYLRS